MSAGRLRGAGRTFLTFPLVFFVFFMVLFFGIWLPAVFFAGAISSLLEGLKRSGKKNLGGRMSELSKIEGIR